MCSFQGALKEKREKAKAFFCVIGDWSNGMIGVSKTFGGGSIPSSPVKRKPEAKASGFFVVVGAREVENVILLRRSKVWDK